MPRVGRKLAAVALWKLPPGIHGDGLGLWLQVTPAGSRSWLFRYMLEGRARGMGLGPLHTIGLAEARERALEARRLVLDGVDPIEHRKEGRRTAALDAARAVNFSECAERYIRSHEAGWQNPKHRDQWRSTLRAYAFPLLGDLPVAAVDRGLCLKVLEPIWHTKSETASRVRGRIESVLDWAAARGYRAGENPARWRGHLDKLLPLRSKIAPVKHHPAMPYRNVPAFMADLRGNGSISAFALELTILTVLRTSEAIGATWPEIDHEARVWTVPARRMGGLRPGMKGGKREHRVPLSDRCMVILAALPRVGGCPYMFPGSRTAEPLSNMAMAQLLRGMRPALTVHGFRSSFRDWTAELTEHPGWLAEAALGHTVGNKVEAAYRRGDALEKRRALMADWADFCGGAT
jgi:integrase